MRVLRRLSILIVPAIVAVAACSGGSGGQAGWTYAPAPSITAAPSGAASGSPEASAPAGSQAPGPSGTAGASGEPGGEVVTVVATSATKFDTPELSAPADTPFTLRFDNRDPSAPHNVVIQNPDGSNVDMGDTAFFQGPEVRDYQVPALAAGEYPFLCQVHPTTMKGTLTVG